MSLPANDIISGPIHLCKCSNESRNCIRLCALLIIIDLFVIYKQTSMKSYQSRQLHWTVIHLILFYHINERNDRFIEQKIWIILENVEYLFFCVFELQNIRFDVILMPWLKHENASIQKTCSLIKCKGILWKCDR